MALPNPIILVISHCEAMTVFDMYRFRAFLGVKSFHPRTLTKAEEYLKGLIERHPEKFLTWRAGMALSEGRDPVIPYGQPMFPTTGAHYWRRSRPSTT